MDTLHQAVQWSLLFDFYGPLLTEHQAEVFDLYHGADLSLGEIADHFAISRQAVYDILKRSERSLLELEERLGLVAKYVKQQELIENLRSQVKTLALTGDSALSARLEEILELLAQLQSI